MGSRVRQVEEVERSRVEHRKRQQIYDNTLKALFGDEAAEIIPRILPHTQVISEQNIEIDRTKLKADLVYYTTYRGTPTILNMELQTKAEKHLEHRLLQYHVGLHAKHELPVVSLLIYPFKTKVQRPPYEEKIAGEVCLTFQYKILCLWEMDAELFVRDHVVCMYTLLPAMRGANAPLLKQALQEMAQHYTRGQLGHHLIRFRNIMERATTMSEQDKREVEEDLDMLYEYDEFIDDNPHVQKRMTKSWEKGLEEGLEKGLLKGEEYGKKMGERFALRQLALDVVQSSFPDLLELARERIDRISDAPALHKLILQLMRINEQETMRRYLEHS